MKTKEKSPGFWVWRKDYLILAFVALCILALLYLYPERKKSQTSSPFQLPGDLIRKMDIYVQPESITAKIGNRNLCHSQSGNIFLLILIFSAPKNINARNAIRGSWMSIQRDATYIAETNVTGADIRMAFLVGDADNGKLQKQIDKESEIYRDIIQEEFIDTYHNLTVKSIMMLKWMTSYCSHARFVLKTDDDMFINVPLLVRYLDQPEIRSRDDLITGYVFCGSLPFRNPSSKWYTPHYMYRRWRYPNFVSGPGYVLSGSAASILYKTALETSFFHLEDVFLTGLVAQRANLTPQHNELFSFDKQPLSKPCIYREIVSSHGLDPDEIVNIWQLIRDEDLDCSHQIRAKIDRTWTGCCCNFLWDFAAFFFDRFGSAG